RLVSARAVVDEAVYGFQDAHAGVEPDVPRRLHAPAASQHFEVQVRAGRVTGRADLNDLRGGADPLADRRDDAGQVRVQGGEPATVGYPHVVPIRGGEPPH